jgi:hypothetical protein
MSRESFTPFRVRTNVNRALYERIVREAAARAISVSECIRRDLEEIYALRDAAVTREGAGAGGASTIELVAAEVANRLADPLGELQEIVPKLQQIEAMIDRHYAGVMGYLSEPSTGDEPARLRAASRRYDAWRRAVAELLGAGDRER